MKIFGYIVYALGCSAVGAYMIASVNVTDRFAREKYSDK